MKKKNKPMTAEQFAEHRHVLREALIRVRAELLAFQNSVVSGEFIPKKAVVGTFGEIYAVFTGRIAVIPMTGSTIVCGMLGLPELSVKANIVMEECIYSALNEIKEKSILMVKSS